MPDHAALEEIITLLFALKDAKGDNDLRVSIMNALFEEVRMIDPDLLARMPEREACERKTECSKAYTSKSKSIARNGSIETR